MSAERLWTRVHVKFVLVLFFGFHFRLSPNSTNREIDDVRYRSEVERSGRTIGRRTGTTSTLVTERQRRAGVVASDSSSLAFFGSSIVHQAKKRTAVRRGEEGREKQSKLDHRTSDWKNHTGPNQVGGMREHGANELLKAYAPPKATVLRDGSDSSTRLSRQQTSK